MKYGVVLRSAVLSSILLITSCGRPADFLYYYTETPPLPKVAPVPMQVNVQVKDTIGSPFVDILWVVDNSASMGDDHKNMIANMSEFIKEFIKNPWLQWKMGLISTDIIDPPYLGFKKPFDYTSTDPVGEFNRGIMDLGTIGSGHEEGFEPVEKVLTKYPKFLRPSAKLAVIFVTDAEEQSSGTPAAFSQSLLNQKSGKKDDILAFGIFGSKDFLCKDTGGETPWNYKGSRYEEFIQTFNGSVYPLCSPQFGQNLADLSKKLVQLIYAPKISLKNRPKVSTIRIEHKGVPLPGGPEHGIWYYDYDLNAVVFQDLSWAAGDFEFVTVSYEQDE